MKHSPNTSGTETVYASIRFAGQKITTLEVYNVPITTGGRRAPLALTPKTQTLSVAVITNFLKDAKKQNTVSGNFNKSAQRGSKPLISDTIHSAQDRRPKRKSKN